MDRLDTLWQRQVLSSNSIAVMKSYFPPSKKTVFLQIVDLLIVLLYFTFCFFNEEEFVDKFIQLTFSSREEKKKNVEYGKASFEQIICIITTMFVKYILNMTST